VVPVCGVLAASIDGDPASFVVKQHGGYRLNPDAIEIALWRLRTAHAASRRTGGTDNDATVAALRQVCEIYAGPLAAAKDYDWAEPHRQGVLNLALDAYTRLAATLIDTDPGQAARLLDNAISHDPVNETLYQHAMRAHQANADHEAIPARMHQLINALRRIGAEPTEKTVALYRDLPRDLGARTTRQA